MAWPAVATTATGAAAMYEQSARQEAAMKLVSNHANLLKDLATSDAILSNLWIMDDVGTYAHSGCSCRPC